MPAFWLLAGSFAICGATTNGLIGTHLIPAAHDHGLSETTAASLLALVGIFDIVGTLCSGWLTDRMDPRRLLLWYYGLRGVSLLVLAPALADGGLGLVGFVVFYGLDWVATVPPTVALCHEVFGREKGTVVFGWVSPRTSSAPRSPPRPPARCARARRLPGRVPLRGGPLPGGGADHAGDPATGRGRRRRGLTGLSPAGGTASPPAATGPPTRTAWSPCPPAPAPPARRSPSP